MRLTVQLARILEEHGVALRGAIGKISKATGLERHKVAALLHNRAQYVSLEALARLCDYLVRVHHLDPGTLPGVLFSHEPGSFEALLTERSRINVFVGMRRRLNDAERSWVMASDSMLYSDLSQEISNVRSRAGQLDSVPVDLELLPGYSKKGESTFVEEFPEIFETARERYRELEHSPAQGIICIGSMKSNPMFELVVARAFGATAFEEEKKTKATERRCPFFFAYRHNDVAPPSCCGGRKLTSRQKRPSKPGLYYEDEHGKWQHCSCEDTEDVGLVLYVFQPTRGRLELVLSGFTGRATHGLCEVVKNRRRELWPPQHSTDEMQYGAFIVKFSFPDGSVDPSPESAAIEIVPMAESALTRRIG